MSHEADQVQQNLKAMGFSFSVENFDSNEHFSSKRFSTIGWQCQFGMTEQSDGGK